MSLTQVVQKSLHYLRISFVVLTIFQFSIGGPLVAPMQAQDKVVPHTKTPIKHVIVLIGENRTFDHVFATYVPKSKDSVSNLLSKGIINADGTAGPHFSAAAQFQNTKPYRTSYFIGLNNNEKAPYTILPEPTLNFSPVTNSLTAPPFPTFTPLSLIGAIEPSLDADDLSLLTTGAATGFPQSFFLPDFDSRIQNYNSLPNGPFPLKGTHLPYDSYTGDMTHRLFEMWQQSDCNIKNATRHNPSGCLSELYPFVITNYTNIIDPFDTPPAFDDNGGGNSMAFYNVQAGDAPVLKSLADEYSMSDNFHQSVMGGTGANHVMLGTGDAIFWSDGKGTPTTPPSHIANPNPQAGTDDVYTVDLLFDGNFTECGNPSQPGVQAIRDYLESLPYDPEPNCQPSHYYMINNDSPGFLPDGTVDTAGIAGGGSVPPTDVRTIGEALNEKNISWAYYGGAYNAAVAVQHDPTNPSPLVQIGHAYCNICNFESYATKIMGDPAQRAAHIKDATDFFAAIDNDTLPSVSFVKPDGLLDGHPASSKLIVSPFTKGGHISHTYTDHVSILKFIEQNWDLKPLTKRSRDNFPNPKVDGDNPYVPTNSPAIGDLMDMFDFGHHEGESAHR